MTSKELVEKLLLIAAWRKPGGPTPDKPKPSTHKIATEAATRITALEAENAELVRDRDTLMMFAQSIQTWREDADSYDSECGHEPRNYCEDVELMVKSATNTLRRIAERATLAKHQEGEGNE